MKRMTKLISSMVLALIIAFSASVTGFASTVTYLETEDGNARQFVFAPDNLFEDLANVMPGDTLTQQITIRNRRLLNVRAVVYIRSVGAEEGSEEFLSQLKMTVALADEDDTQDAIMFNAPADQTAQLTEWTQIGTIYSGGNIDLNITLEVPLDLDNKFQDAVGNINWQFRIEEFDISPDEPVTGDESTLFLFAILCLISIAIFATLILIQKKRKREEKQ